MDLSVNDLKISIAAKEIVKGVSLDVSGQRFIGLLGPNGSGKSTLLKSIYRMLRPSGGVILLGGKDIHSLSQKKLAKEMAVVSQFNSINFEFFVKEIVMMGRTPHLTMLQQERLVDYQIVNEALEKVGMLPYADRLYSTLSGGEKQRIILARAIAQEPKLLILDEPTNHLDITYQLQALSIIKNLGVNVLSALHDLELAAMYCDSIYILKDGMIHSKGTPEAVVTPAMIEQVYGVLSDVSINPSTGNMVISYFHDTNHTITIKDGSK